MSEALEAGYRHIDTAAAYRNEAGVGKAIAASGIPRDELFVTTKLWNDQQGHDQRAPAFAASARAARPRRRRPVPHPLADRDGRPLRRDLPGASPELQADGPGALDRRLELPGGAPAPGGRRGRRDAVGQPDRAAPVPAAGAGLRAVHAELGIATEAWSPIAQGAVLDDPAITAIADRHGRTPAQVVLRWHLQLGNIVIPKSVTPERIRENLALFDFELSAEDLATIAALDRDERTGPDPDTFSLGA